MNARKNETTLYVKQSVTFIVEKKSKKVG